jgi:integration host factor subunit alpha
MALTQGDLIHSLQDQCRFSKQKSRILIETTFELIKKALESGGDVLISGFGKFFVRKKAARKGRNPATGNGLILDAGTVVIFMGSPVLREKISGAE